VSAARRDLAELLGAAEPEEARPPERRFRVAPDDVPGVVGTLLGDGAHLAGVTVTEAPERALLAVLALRGELVRLRAPLAGATSYPSLARLTPAALLPERELHDAHGVVPRGHPALTPVLHPDADELPRVVTGPDTFVIPYGPIRSGVFEAIQYPIDTGGEDVLALTVRPYFKRRGLEGRFGGRTVADAAFVAERVAGPASVAHAIAFATAVERAAGAEVPQRAERWRVVHAELERIAAHLDVACKLADDAALSVGAARFGALKEQVMRLRARLCGSRFGRGVVVPGGIREAPLLDPAAAISALDAFELELRRDRRLLLRTPSFTDRLIGSGRLDAATVEAHGGVGPVARACSLGIDARQERPYGAYRKLGFRIAHATDGDAMARLAVRFEEIGQSLHLVRQALDRLERLGPELQVAVRPLAGEALGWSEAPAGELVYHVVLEAGRVAEARIFSPSLRNLPLFAESFRGDVLTDVSFIEHSFGLAHAEADR
jgi:formate hydrogenlyase subunit 5